MVAGLSRRRAAHLCSLPVTSRSPARLLAPLALVLAVIALIVVIASGGQSPGPGTSAEPAATATSTASSRRSSQRKRARTYTVKPGDTPSGIADATGVDLQALLAANPDADPGALSPGDKLKLPAK